MLKYSEPCELAAGMQFISVQFVFSAQALMGLNATNLAFRPYPGICVASIFLSWRSVLRTCTCLTSSPSHAQCT